MSSSYTVKKGDYLHKIARNHGVTLGELLSANPKFATRDPNLILIGETIEIPDTSAFCSSIDLKKGLAKCPKEKTEVLSESEAQEMFDLLKKEAHIPFDYPIDCCYARAHEMCRIMEKNGVEPRKYWLYDKDWPYDDRLEPKDKEGNPITFPDEFGNRGPVTWTYHVAPMVKVRKADGTIEDRIIDPSIASKPVRKDEWKDIMGNPVGSYTEETGSDLYLPGWDDPVRKVCWAGETDPDGEKTSARFIKHEKDREERLDTEKQLNAAGETS